MNHLTESMGYFTEAIDSAEAGLQSEVGNVLLTEFYIHRSSVYEALGLMELASRDMFRILDLDPRIELKYRQELEKQESQGRFEEAKRTREFLNRLKQLG